MEIKELEKLCNRNDVEIISVYNKIKEIIVKETLVRDKIEGHFSDINNMFQLSIENYGDKCHASLGGAENFCALRSYSCAGCPLKFETFKDFMKCNLIYKNMHNGKKIVWNVIYPIVMEIVREDSLNALESIKEYYGEEQYTKIEKKYEKNGLISPLEPMGIKQRDIPEPAETLFLIFSLIQLEIKRNRFHFYLPSVFSDEEFDDLCKVIFEII